MLRQGNTFNNCCSCLHSFSWNSSIKCLAPEEQYLHGIIIFPHERKKYSVELLVLQSEQTAWWNWIKLMGQWEVLIACVAARWHKVQVLFFGAPLRVWSNNFTPLKPEVLQLRFSGSFERKQRLFAGTFDRSKKPLNEEGNYREVILHHVHIKQYFKLFSFFFLFYYILDIVR